MMFTPIPAQIVRGFVKEIQQRRQRSCPELERPVLGNVKDFTSDRPDQFSLPSLGRQPN